MTRTIEFSGYQYRADQDGICFRRSGAERGAWKRASNFDVEIINAGEVIDGEVYVTVRFTHNGRTVDHYMPRDGLRRTRRLVPVLLGSTAVVFVVPGAQRRIHTAALVFWLEALETGAIPRSASSPQED